VAEPVVIRRGHKTVSWRELRPTWEYEIVTVRMYREREWGLPSRWKIIGEEYVRGREETRAKEGPNYLGRFLSLPPGRDIRKIWEMAEEKLGIDWGIFSLVHESHYLPETGILEDPAQIFEIMVRGRAGGKKWPAELR
jgi:hypothetical protein